MGAASISIALEFTSSSSLISFSLSRALLATASEGASPAALWRSAVSSWLDL